MHDSLESPLPAARPRRGNGRFGRRLLIFAAAIAAIVSTVAAGAEAAKPPAGPPDFGPNVKIFDPGMPLSQIQATVDAIASQQVNDEMGTQRYALLFKPGTYGSAATPLIFQVGYYTEVAGLGASPTDVTINGHIDVFNRSLAPGFNDRAEQLLALAVEPDHQRVRSAG